MFSQYLLVTSLLLTSSLSYDCVKLNTLSQKDQQLATKLRDLNGTDNGLIAAGGFGRVYIFPDDISKVVKLQILEDESLILLDEIDITKIFSDKDTALAGDPRLAPTLFKTLCIDMSNDRKFVIMISERFRGDLQAAVTEDPRFSIAMKEFSTRMDFYIHMIASFGEIAKLGYKHCDLKPDNILYKESDADWEADYAEGEAPLGYFPVITDFGLSVPWSTQCKGASPGFTDPQDYKEEMRFFDKDKAKVEIYTMALIIFFMETSILGNYAALESGQDAFKDSLEAVHGHSKQLAAFISAGQPFAYHSMQSIFEGFRKLHTSWNENTVQYSHDLLKNDLEFFISAMNMYYEFILSKQGANSSQVESLLVQYKIFTETLLTMVRKNNISINKRPSYSEVVQSFQAVKASSIEIEQTIGQRRGLMLI